MRHILTIICMSGMGALIAQDQLPTGQIEVIKDFEVKLTEAKKIRIVPQPILLDTAARHYTYTLTAASPQMTYATPPLKPLAIEPEQKPAYYPFFAKAGYGNPNAWLGALSYDHRSGDDLQYGIDVRHLSANNKKIPLQQFSDSRGRINGAYRLRDDIHLEAAIDARFQKDYFYGAEDIPSDKDELRRLFRRYDADLRLTKLRSPQSALHYQGELRYLFDKDDLGARESGAILGAEVGTAFGKNNFPVGLSATVDMSRLTHTAKYDLNNILLEPYVEGHAGKLGFRLGGIGLLNKAQDEILPSIELSYRLLGERMKIAAGWKGSVVKNNFHSLSGINPYIDTRLDDLRNTVSRSIYAVVRGAAGTFGYDITGSYVQFTNKAFFLQNPIIEEQYVPVYDDGHYIGVEGALNYALLRHVMLRGQAYGRFYTLDREEKPWHTPTFGLDGMITYTGGSDEYHVSLTFHGENGLPYRTVGGTEGRLKALLDLNLQGDYYLTSALGAFVEINNILGNKRERWYAYPGFGFNAKAGIVFRLPE